MAASTSVTLPAALNTTIKHATFYVAVLVVFGIARISGSGVDYFYTYHSHVVYWLNGHSQVYVQDPSGFYNPPWLLWILAPFSFLPPDWELPLFQLAMAFSVALALDLMTGKLSGYTKLLSMMLGLVNLIVFDLINRGQIDTLPLFGAILFLVGRPNWLKAGLGYTLLSIKPPNTVPLLIYFFVRDWITRSPREALKGLIIPAVVLLVSFVLHGWWPVNLMQVLGQQPPLDTWRTTIWRAAEVLNLGIIVPLGFSLAVIGLTIWLWRLADTPSKQIALVVLATFLVTPYALSYHYIFVLALILPALVAWKWWIGVGLYLLTFLPIIRIWVGLTHSYIDLLFILGCYISVACWLISTHPLKSTSPSDLNAKISA